MEEIKATEVLGMVIYGRIRNGQRAAAETDFFWCRACMKHLLD